MFSMESMESSTIALIIRYFNIAAVAVLAVFAVYGLVIVVRKKFSANFLPAFCAAALVAFVAEGVFFNYAHYLKYFAGGEVHLTEAHINMGGGGGRRVYAFRQQR